MIILKIIVFVTAVALFISLNALLILCIKYLAWFYFRPCKHCGHNMKYKGLKEDSESGHFLFHCPHCGAWQQIPRQEFFKNFVGEEFNPYKEKI